MDVQSTSLGGGSPSPSPDITPNPAPNAGTAPQRPDHIPEKFWDATTGTVKADELAKSYGELEKKLGTKPAETPAPAPITTGTNLSIDAATQQKLDSGGIKVEDLQAEYAKEGKLSPETYAKIGKAGIPAAMVDGYIEGQKAIAERTQQEVFAAVGGKDEYTKAVQWAAENLSPEEITAYNESLRGKDATTIKVAAAGLVARMKTNTTNSPEKLTMGGEAGAAEAPFKTNRELTAAMADKRYRTDPEYRAGVIRRLSISNI